ncbi:IclR family transcriptional regulator C-terminal domain-containing protein [Streptomyces sp. NPDC021749]|uniref:IclR family transcriptional regulator domain-containing protein n=1 Tax=Streptomyces sp. NPDC021749 TaxID=3154905 RepID=UPI0033E6BC65
MEPDQVRPEDLDAFLARMREYAESGVTMDLEDNEPGIRCVAAPIRDATGTITGAISVSATRPYMPAARMRGLTKVIGCAAQRISAGLGHREP